MATNVVVKVVAVPMGEAINGGRFDDFNLFWCIPLVSLSSSSIHLFDLFFSSPLIRFFLFLSLFFLYPRYSPFSRFTVRFAPVFLPNAITRTGYRGEYNRHRLHPDERDDELEELTIRQFKSTSFDRRMMLAIDVLRINIANSVRNWFCFAKVRFLFLSSFVSFVFVFHVNPSIYSIVFVSDGNLSVV